MIVNTLLLIVICILVLILLVSDVQKSSNFNNKNTYAIQTVFILKENIPFLREWLIYHILIGFNKFYLYDNTGSKGRNGSTPNINKYNINFNELVKLSDDECKIEMNNILDDFKEYVTYIEWKPLDKNGEVIYALGDSINHYVKTFGNENTYTAFIDIDEYIFLNNYNNINEYITKYNKDKYVIYQHKFVDRYSYPNKDIYELNDTIENINTSSWAPKNIVMNKYILSNLTHHIHNISTTNNIKVMNTDINEIRFNHYNINKKQIEWMKNFFNKTSFDHGKDYSMLLFKNKILNHPLYKKNNFINMEYFNKNRNNFSYF